jgi:hypothetical protein
VVARKILKKVAGKLLERYSQTKPGKSRAGIAQTTTYSPL